MATDRAIVRYLDYYKKSGTIKVNIPVVTAANFTAQNTLLTAFVSAVTAIALGTNVESYVDAMLVTHTPTPPTNQAAIRETKWLVRAVDQINGRSVRWEIPTADVTQLVNNQPFLDLTGGVGASFKTAAEAYVLSIDGNAITVISVEFVPRKN